MNSIYVHLLSSILIFIIGFITFLDIFKYGICCDDIFAAFNNKAYSPPFSSIFSPYGGQVLGMKIMFKLFEFNHQYYFYTTFLLRIVTSITVYFLSLTLSKNKLAATLTALLFVVGYAGLNTAEYAHLAPIFIGTIFLNLGLIMLIKYYENFLNKISVKSISTFVIICLLFSIAIVIATVRVNGLVIYYLIIESCLLLFKFTRFKSAIIRMLIFSLFILILRHLGSFGGSSPYHLSMIKDGIINTLGSINSAVQTIYYLTAIYYDILSPPILDKSLLTVLEAINLHKLINNNGIFIFLAFILLLFNFRLAKHTKKYAVFLCLSILWILYLVGFKWAFGDLYTSYGYGSLPINTTSYLFDAMNTLLGGLFIFLIVNIILWLYHQKETLNAFKTFLLLIWPLCFIGTTYLFSPRTFQFGTWAAYLVETQESYVHYYFIPALGVYLLLGYLLFNSIPAIKKLTLNFNYYTISFFLLFLLVILNIYSTKEYTLTRMYYRSAEALNTTSNTINNEIKAHYQIQQKPIVYIASIDDHSIFYPYVVSEWGFAEFRYALINKAYHITPFFVNGDLSNLKPLIGNKEFAKDHNFKQPVTINDIYSFKLEKGNVYSLTNEIRAQLLQELNSK